MTNSPKIKSLITANFGDVDYVEKLKELAMEMPVIQIAKILKCRKGLISHFLHINNLPRMDSKTNSKAT